MTEPEEKKIVHRVEISRDPEVHLLEQELAKAKSDLETSNAILEQASLQEFERLRGVVRDKYPQAKSLIDSCSTPQMLDGLLDNLRASYGTGKTYPTGKASLIPPKGEKEYGSQQEMIDDLYSSAYYKYKSEKEITEHKEEIADARAKIDTLLRNMVSSPSWKEMRERGTSPIERHKISSCRKCGYTLVDTNTCPNCGYNAFEKQKVRD